MHRKTILWLSLSFLAACGLAVGACIVDVPDIETDTFACETDEDCASGYVCSPNKLCEKEGEIEEGGCRHNPCPDGKTCAKRSDGTSHCLDSCNDYYGCPAGVNGKDAACVRTWVYDNAGKEVLGRICLGCPPACNPTDRCHLTKDDGSGFTDKMETACFGFKTCTNESACLPNATLSACMKRGPALGNECWPIPDACSSDPHLRSKMTLDNASGVPTDVCVACLSPLCESGQICTPPSSADGTLVLRNSGVISCVCDEGLCDQDKPPEYTCSAMNKCEPPF